jgi:tRNA nucleotidyltransferase/poly(A) polymerase
MKDMIRKILKENKEIRVKMDIPVPNSINKIHKIFKDNGFKLYLVGGAVRDSLMGGKPKDFDLATDAVPDKVKELLPMYNTIESGEQFAVVNVVTEDDTYEIATFREDIGKGRRPDEVKFSTIDKDVLRRDLTINALFYDLDTGEVVDLVGGISDLENGVVKTVGNAEDRFDEDKLRIMRSMRFAARVGSDVDKGIDEAIKKDNSIVSGDGKPLAQERIQDEFIKGIIQAKSVKQFIGLLRKYDLMKWVFQDLNTDGEVVESKVPIIVISSILRNEIDTNLDKKLIGRLKFTKLQGKQVKFLIDFFRNGETDTAFEFKNKLTGLHLDNGIISNFGRLMGMDTNFIKTFIKYQITTDGGQIAKQGFRGKEINQEKERIETEKFKMLMGKSTISYSGVVLDGESQNHLVSVLYEHFKDIEDWKVYCHHMTVNLGPLPMKLRGLIGQDIELTVTDIGSTSDVVAVKVDTPLEVSNKTPHVTLAVSPSGKPRLSNDITSWTSLEPFKISGTLQEIPFK